MHILGSFDPIRHDQSVITQTTQYSSCIQNPPLLHSALVCIQFKPGKQKQKYLRSVPRAERFGELRANKNMGELYDIFELVVRTLTTGICRCLAAYLAPTYNYYSKLALLILSDRVRFNVSTTICLRWIVFSMR